MKTIILDLVEKTVNNVLDVKNQEAIRVNDTMNRIADNMRDYITEEQLLDMYEQDNLDISFEEYKKEAYKNGYMIIEER